MKIWMTIRQVLTVLAVAGLALKPIAPVMAGTGPAPMAMSESQDAMPAGMPCCPEKVPVPDCSKQCPLLALCSAFYLTATRGGEAVTPLYLTSVLPLINDAPSQGLAQPPPPKPPKS